MDISAIRGLYKHNFTQFAVIFIGLLIPVVEMSKINYDILGWGISIISILGLIVAALTTLNRQLGFEKKWRHYRMTAEIMRNEGDDFFALAGNYKKFTSHKEGFKAFATSVTSFKRQEIKTYMEEEKNRKKDK